MKRPIGFALASILALTASTAPLREARAAITVLAVGSGVVAQHAWIFLLLSLGGFAGAFMPDEPGAHRGLLARIGYFFAGVMLLDSDAGTVAFRPLSDADAAKLGVSPEERERFNAERELVNAILETIQTETEARFAARDGGAVGTEEDSRFVRGLWDEYSSGALSPETRAAVRKLLATRGPQAK